jgi:hypothetical protein
VVGISSNTGRWRAIDLRAGQKATVVRDQAPTQSIASPQELEELTRRYGPVEKAAPISQGTAVGTGIAIGAVVATVIYVVTKDSHHGSNKSNPSTGLPQNTP